MSIDLNVLHRLQRLRHCLPGGKQHRRGGQRPGARRGEMHWMRVDTYYQGSPDNPGHLHSRCPACSARTRPANWSARCRPPRIQRRPERHGLQPLRGHALLLQQLPVQGAALQFPAVHGFRNAQPETAAQPGCDRAQPRRHGEVHLLRAAHQRDAKIEAEKRGPHGARRRNPDRLPGSPARREAIVFGDINDKNSRVSKTEARAAELRPAGRI